MTVAAEDGFPQHGFIERLKNIPRTAKVMGAIAVASLVGLAGNTLISHDASPVNDEAVPTLTGDLPKTPAPTFGVGERQEAVAVATTEPAPVTTAAKAVVAKPRPETRPTQTTPTTAEQLTSFEKAEALARAATVQIRYQDKNASDQSYNATRENNTATHIGNGIFIDTRHSTRYQQFGPDGPKKDVDGVHDIASMSLERDSIWIGSGPGQMTRKAEIKGIVVNDNDSRPDFRLMYAPEAAGMPSLKLAKEKPNLNDDYFVTGYPEVADGKQMQFPAKFLAEATVGDINYQDPKTGEYSFPQNNDERIYLFGIPKGVSGAESACSNGWSGGGIGNEKSETFGVLAFTSLHTSKGGGSDTVWQGARDRNPNADNMQVICGFTVVDQAMVANYQAHIGQPTP